LILFIVFSFLFVACGEQVDTAETPGTGIYSEKQRITTPSSADVPELVSGNTAFALDVYGKLTTEPGNLFFSPHSISLALAMTWSGAHGTTETQMADVLHFNLSQDLLHPAFGWLDLTLNGRGQGAVGSDGEPFRLHVVNRLFGQVDYTFLPSFLDTLALYYGAGMHLLDFMADPEAGRLVINGWVADQTEDRIEDLIPQGAIDTLTRLVLVNAIYFNAAWKEVFDDELTQNGVFHRPNGIEISVPMMTQPTSMPSAQSADYKAVELAYDGDELSMVVIVPQGDFTTFEQEFASDSAVLDSLLEALGSSYATVTMPRFTIDGNTISLTEVLSELGMPDAFIPGTADFSAMDGTYDLYISDVLHQAFVTVNEYGTEAAAATSVIMGETSIPDHIDIDRPFIFLIRDIETGAILFIGRIVDPSLS
jgi:serpin B